MLCYSPFYDAFRNGSLSHDIRVMNQWFSNSHLALFRMNIFLAQFRICNEKEINYMSTVPVHFPRYFKKISVFWRCIVFIVTNLNICKTFGEDPQFGQLPDFKYIISAILQHNEYKNGITRSYMVELSLRNIKLFFCYLWLIPMSLNVLGIWF